MPYATYQQVINRYPVLATWNSSQTIVNSDLIYFAEQELDSMLGTHFAVPFAEAYPVVVDLTIDMAYWRAVRFKDKEMAEKVRSALMDRIEALKQGREAILTASGTAIAPAGQDQTIWSSVEGQHPVHSMLDVTEEFVDDDRLDAEVDERE